MGKISCTDSARPLQGLGTSKSWRAQEINMMPLRMRYQNCYQVMQALYLHGACAMGIPRGCRGSLLVAPESTVKRRAAQPSPRSKFRVERRCSNVRPVRESSMETSFTWPTLDEIDNELRTRASTHRGYLTCQHLLSNRRHVTSACLVMGWHFGVDALHCAFSSLSAQALDLLKPEKGGID